MKIVCIGDILLTADMMKTALASFDRYTEADYFHFGPENRNDFRSYIKKMETHGFDCEPLPDAIYEAVRDADVLQVHTAPVPGKLLEVARNLKLILSNRGGTENIDLPSAAAKEVAVLCNPAHNANAVAEMTVGLILAETRNIARNHVSLVRDRVWYEAPPNAGNIHELSSLTVGLVGFGTIGRLVARLLTAFGSRLLVFDPYANPDDIASCGAQSVAELDMLLAQSDVVSLHARVTEANKGLIGEHQLAVMKPTAVLINTARPALIDMDALAAALRSRSIMGAALDVFPTEPIDLNSPLLALDNVTLTCHKGGDTIESYANSPAMLLTEAEKYFQGGTPRFLVRQ